MGVFKKTVKRLQEDIRLSSNNASSFDENWSFVTTRFRIISLVTLVLLIFGVLFFIFVFYGPTASYFRTEDVSISRQTLDDQNKRVEDLQGQIKSQEIFIQNIQAVLQGKIAPDSITGKPQTLENLDLSNVKNKTTKAEGELARKVKDDMRTVQKKEVKDMRSTLFEAPVRGTISETFSFDRHPAVDIVCKKESSIKACMDGVILYTGYSKKDGNFIIIDHGRSYVSIYKHNKVILKSTGQRVQLGDPIAIAGNSGENSTGPHLHFELWFEQRPIDPQTFMTFN